VLTLVRNIYITTLLILDNFYIWVKWSTTIYWRNLSSGFDGQSFNLFDLPSHAVDKNRILWNLYDWSCGGEEWSNDAKKYKGLEPDVWKNMIFHEFMMKYIKNGCTILEVGPGAGRWTELLQKFANRIILVDISKKCLSLCKERFKDSSNMEFHLIERGLDFLPKDSIDCIWSYDVFVHINPRDIRHYISDFHRVLRPGGYAIIHHANKYSNERQARRSAFRSYMNAEAFAAIVSDHQMEIIEQNSTLPHIPGDVISVIKKH
jgi:SAM-dependent methyltransferase